MKITKSKLIQIIKEEIAKHVKKTTETPLMIVWLILFHTPD